MSPAKLKIYLAGKIDKNDWRHSIVCGLRSHNISEGYLEADSFIYTGPYFQSCDHGCFHGGTSHGTMTHFQKQRTVAQQRTFNNCLSGVKDADLIIIYINSSDAYGTLVESGWVQILNKPHVVIFSPGIKTKNKNEFWFATMRQPLDVIYGVSEQLMRSTILRIIDDYRLDSTCGE
jgi:hypothetical protein